MHILFILILSAIVLPVGAQFDALPDSPLDSSMGNSVGGTAGAVNQLSETDEEQREEEDPREEEDYTRQTDAEFNRNWNEEAQAFPTK